MLPHEFLWEVLFFTGRLIKTVLVVWTYPTWYLVLFISSLVALIVYQCFTDATRSNEARDRAGKLGPPRLGLLSLINSRPGPVTPSDLASALNPVGENLIGVCTPYDKTALLRSIRIFGDEWQDNMLGLNSMLRHGLPVETWASTDDWRCLVVKVYPLLGGMDRTELSSFSAESVNSRSCGFRSSRGFRREFQASRATSWGFLLGWNGCFHVRKLLDSNYVDLAAQLRSDQGESDHWTVAFGEAELKDLAKSVQCVQLKHGQMLCTIGEPDDSIYILESGQLHVSCADDVRSAPSAVRIVRVPGESIYSVVSVVEYLTGFVNRKRLSRILAVGETTVSKLPITALGRVLEKSPESKLRVIQLIMMWIHRVLLVALLSFLRIDGSALMAMKRVFASDELSERVRGDSVVSAETGSQRRSIHSFTPFKISMSDTETSKNLESISPDGDFRWGLKTLKSKLKLEDSYPLEKRLKYLKIPPSTLILRATETDSPLLFVVVGCLSAWIKEPEDDSSENTMEAFTVNRGEMFSGLALLSGEPMLFTVESKGPTKVLAIHREDFGELLRERPEIVTPLAHAVIMRLSPFVRLIDFALDWVHLDAGQVMYRQGEEARNIFIVLAGRIRSLLSKGDKTEAMRDYSRGDMIGIIEVYCKIPRYATMMAVRDSEVVRVPLLLLDFLVAHHPSMVTRLIKYLSKSMATAFHTRAQLVNRGLTHSPGAPETMTTIAVVPTDKYSPVDSFSVELEFALRNICRTVRISSEDVRRNIGKSALEPVGAARLSAWLAQCETENRIVIYQSDHWLSLWTKKCLRQADCILLVGMGDRCPTRREEAVLSDIDEYITSSMTSFRARKDLVLLHRADTVVPEHTEEWLDFHDWCFLHHHIRCPDRMFFRKRARNFHTGYLAAIPSSANDKHNDFARLARILTGTSVGVVLGGGGARGFAHVGMLEALVQHDIPIDMIAGVSMGAYVSALWASRRDIKEVRKLGKFWAEYVLVPWRVALEITYPYIAIFRGRWWNDPVKHSFGDMQIENLWIPYFCSTTDVTDLKPRTHYRGTLWRYVRASMTIAGFIPPMCDPEDGHLLIDGGYSDNLPAVVLKERGAGTIIAIDESEKMTFSYGDEFSGWMGLKQQFWPWGTSFALPNIVELFTRYMRPPIGSFGTMEFKSYDEIVDVGYYYGLMTFVDDGVVRSTLAEMEKQLLTTSFGLYVPNTAVLPVLGQYLTDLASYVTVQEDHRDSEEKDYRDSDEMFISNIQLTELKSVDSPPANAAAAEKPEDEDASPQLLHPIGSHESLDELWRHALSEPDLTPVKLAESFWAYSL